MKTFNSKRAIVSKAPSALYMVFVDMRNFLQMLPPDKKEGVEADYDSIKATVQGFNIGVRVVNRQPYSLVEFKDDGAPFEFNLALHFDSVLGEENKTEFYIDLSAELNFMMQTLLGSKLKSGLDKIVDAIVDVSEGRMPQGIDPSKL